MANTRARISATSFVTSLLDNTKSLRTALEKYVHFVPISYGVVSELLNSILPEEEHRKYYNEVYSKLVSLYPNTPGTAIDINNIASIITNSNSKRLSGKTAVGIYKDNSLIGVLTSNYGNASKLVVKVIQDTIGVDLAVGHVVGNIQVLQSSKLGGHLWIKNNLSMRSPLSMKLAVIQELFMLAEHIANDQLDDIISWYFNQQGTYYTAKHSFLILKDALNSTGKVFTGDLNKLSNDTTVISKTAIVSGIKSFYTKYFKPVNEKLKRAGDDLSASQVTSYIKTGLDALAEKHMEYYNKVIDTSVITKEFTSTLSSLKIIFVLPQTSLFNSGELAALEKTIAREAIAFGNTAENFKSSPSLKEYVIDTIIDTIKDGSSKEFSNKVTAVTGKVNGLKLKAPKVSKATQKVYERKSTPTTRLRNLQGQFTSLVKLETLIRSLLLETIQKNMQRPNLRNQTGRFAQSIKLDRLQRERDGSLTAFLSYMKYPYATFEKGGRQGFRGYYPSRLLDQSAREIATKLVTARLKTVIV